jgi:hypothetical protein
MEKIFPIIIIILGIFLFGGFESIELNILNADER